MIQQENPQIFLFFISEIKPFLHTKARESPVCIGWVCGPINNISTVPAWPEIKFKLRTNRTYKDIVQKPREI